MTTRLVRYAADMTDTHPEYDPDLDDPDDDTTGYEGPDEEDVDSAEDQPEEPYDE